MYIPQFIHFTVDEHLDHYQFWAIMNSVAVSILEHVFWCTYVRISVG